VTRYTLLNDALARGQIAGSRAAKSGLARAVPPGCHRACLGVYAADPDVRGQFNRGFGLGYDLVRPRTGADDMTPEQRAAMAMEAASPDPSSPPPPYVPSTPTGPVPSYTSTPGAPKPKPTYAPSAPKPLPAPPKAPVVYTPPVKAGLFGLSRNATIALGVGAGLAIVGGVYFGTRE